MQTNSFFNFDDFKKWMKDKPEEDSQKFKRKSFNGISVESKIGVRKLISKMETNNGDVYDIAQEFVDNGGIVKESQLSSPHGDKYFLIETDLGDFYIHRSYVRSS